MELLTEKCKKDFEEWRLNIHKKEWIEKPDSKGGYEFYGYSIFKELPLEMRYGVYVNFFRQSINTKAAEHILYGFVECCVIGHTTNEAINQAVKHANKFYNKQ